MGLAECFRQFGATGRNPRWSWSARSPDGATVVLTLWKDAIRVVGKTVAYDCFGLENLENWTRRPGNRERIDNLKWARDRCDGLFRVVVTVASDTDAVTRRIAECYPKPDLVMRLTDLDEETGEFRAVSVDERPPSHSSQ